MDDDIIIEQSEMILDMDNFDFSMIDQAPEDAPEEEEAEVEVEEEVEEEEEAEEEAEEEVEEEAEAEADEPEEEEVDFENYQIDLPSGETVVLSELVQGFKNAAALAEEQQKLQSLKEEMESKSAGMDRFLRLAKLEAERVIEDYNDFDWVTLAKEDPQAYVENREFLDKYKARHKEILSAVDDLEQKEINEKKRVTSEKAREANAMLARDIPGWGEAMYRKLIEYGVEKGANQEDLLNSTDPFIFKLLHKNMEHEKGVQTVKAKVKKIGGAPKKVVKAAPKSPSVSKNAKREALLKKAEATGDMSLMFQLLED